MGGIEGVEEPAVDLDAGVRGAEDQGRGEHGENGPVDAEAAHRQAQGILRPAVHQGRKIASFEPDLPLAPVNLFNTIPLPR